MNFIYVQILVTSDRKLVNFSIIATFLNRFRRVAFLVHSTPSDLRSGSSIYHCTMWHIPLRCKWYITFHYRWYIPIRFVWFFYSATGGSDSPLYPKLQIQYLVIVKAFHIVIYEYIAKLFRGVSMYGNNHLRANMLNEALQ